MQISEWISRRRDEINMQVYAIPWTDNPEWIFEDGCIRHVTGGFFSIQGVEIHAEALPYHGRRAPMISQPEIGILGFLIFISETGPKWLLQAKAEPGTVGHVQIGPTVQATMSNYLRLHGGASTAYIDEFLGEDNNPNATLQSEQGSLFINKYNRNIVKTVAEEIECAGTNWRWFAGNDVRLALAEDYLINTDARSVIAASDWSLLCEDRTPFAEIKVCDAIPARLDNSAARRLRAELHESFTAGPEELSNISITLARVRSETCIQLEKIPLCELQNWAIKADGIYSADTGADFDIVNYFVHAPGRECNQWHQPLIRGHAAQRAVLILARQNGLIRVFLRYSVEPGFENQVQLGPSWQSDGLNQQWVTDELLKQEEPPLLAIRQSDEGGRFMRVITDYEIRILALHGTELPAAGGCWVNLAELQLLCSSEGILTNEARSLVSLLLFLA